MARGESTKGQKMAQDLSDFLNSGHTQDKKDFVQAMMQEHRFLQQEVFLLFLQTCEAWSEAHKNDRYDARNEFTVKTATEIVKLIK